MSDDGKMSGGKPTGEKRKRQTKPDANNATRMLHKKSALRQGPEN